MRGMSDYTWADVNRLMSEWNDTIKSVQAQCAQRNPQTNFCEKRLDSVTEVKMALDEALRQYNQWAGFVQRNMIAQPDSAPFTHSMVAGTASSSMQRLTYLFEKYGVVPQSMAASRGTGVPMPGPSLPKKSELSTGALVAIGLGVAGLAIFLTRK